MSEHAIQQQILATLGSGPQRLWRNNVGTGWAGPSTRVTPGNLRSVAAALRPGDVVIRGGRVLHSGLCVGSADLIGYRVQEIGGQRVARFAAVEVKSAKGRPSTEQRAFLAKVQADGGLAGIARSVEDAAAILAGGAPMG